ncbi:MAG: NAD(P)/FAD-dependent oxidoreductase [Chloroflexota bacterium]|nr:NAD(P)/FAD-dependent oxidoreductase [Chloroflexota bacterium]
MKKRKVIVIGGGPAGLMAAGQAAEAGASVVLLEKMKTPGRKLLLTGKGRCNLTNTAAVPEFIERFGPGGKFLTQVFYRFFRPELRSFFNNIGVPTVVERGGRVFPASQKSSHVVAALVRWVRAQEVSIKTRTPMTGLTVKDNCITGVVTPDRNHYADAIILSTGGAAYPGTGSTGDGYTLVESIGHNIIPIRPALVPLTTRGDVAQRLQGLSLKNVRVSLWFDGQKETDMFGEMLFTHFGISGPVILTLSRQIVDALHTGRDVTISIDLKAALDHPTLDARLLRDIDEQGKKYFRTMLKGLMPSKLIPVCVDLTAIPARKRNHQITSEERKRLRLWLKDFRLDVSGHRTFRQALVTAGGVDTTEVDSVTMESILIQGLYFAGEVLDIDADTGGYNLQAAFSTGWAAGRAAASP